MENVKDRINLTRTRISNLLLSNDSRSIILGSILGDGYLQKPATATSNSRLIIKHSIVQEDYFKWKISKLEEIASAKSVNIQSAEQNKGFSKNNSIRFTSRANSELTKLYDMIYEKNNRVNIRRFWLNHLDELSLLIWWLDDGSIIGNGRAGVICTDNFHYEELEIMSKYLKVVWDIEVKIKPKNKTNKRLNINPLRKHYDYRLWLNTKELKKLIIITLPRLECRSMLRKMMLIYKDPIFQQRWITLMKELAPHLSKEIEECYGDKIRN